MWRRKIKPKTLQYVTIYREIAVEIEVEIDPGERRWYDWIRGVGHPGNAISGTVVGSTVLLEEQFQPLTDSQKEEAIEIAIEQYKSESSD